jgi:hypothetical protein
MNNGFHAEGYGLLLMQFAVFCDRRVLCNTNGEIRLKGGQCVFDLNSSTTAWPNFRVGGPTRSIVLYLVLSTTSSPGQPSGRNGTFQLDMYNPIVAHTAKYTIMCT